MIKHTQDKYGNVYGYDDDDASQELAEQRIQDQEHVAYTPPQRPDAELEAKARAAIPSISPRQIRQALSRAGLRASVEAAVVAGDQDLKDWYAFSAPFERNHPQVLNMGSALGQTPEQLDDLWALGATL